jgi:hypothetical protein
MTRNRYAIGKVVHMGELAKPPYDRAHITKTGTQEYYYGLMII